MFDRVLVPLDGSKIAEGVIPYVISEAKLHGATVLVLRVIAPLRQSLMASPNAIGYAYDQIDKFANDYLETVATRFSGEGVEVESILEKGKPAQKIIDTARDLECDLIVIGSHGESGPGQWRFGGVANKVIKAKITIPVLVIPT